MLSNGRVWTVPLKVTLLVPRGGCFLSHQEILLYLGTVTQYKWVQSADTRSLQG